ncbi:hypothetical protein IRJ41_007949 [Triplophysa rosa]|uniref:Uncharacterized protein n=1 Tax=Triplophysa rosa TaxID=992332 RepID=A0A9W7T4V2_TRIRA|nr:hypothetical protein IRJ41_007949 [Triplophysa rosa]
MALPELHAADILKLLGLGATPAHRHKPAGLIASHMALPGLHATDILKDCGITDSPLYP